jgi:hypothetical protein
VAYDKLFLILATAEMSFVRGRKCAISLRYSLVWRFLARG